MRYTKNYKLKQPEADDYVLVEDFNENSDTVDGLIKKIESVIGDLENSEEKDSLIKLIETLQKNKADLGKDGKVVPEQLPEVDLSGIENSIETLGKNALKLGETKTTAYAGDKGKVAYNHSQSTHAPTNAYSKEQSDSNLQAIRNEALKLGTTSTTAYRGDHGLLAYNHSRSNHADPNAITENKVKELLNKSVRLVRVKSYGNENYIDLVKIKNIVFATFNTPRRDVELKCTIPIGFRPRSDYKTYVPYAGGSYGQELVTVSSTTGAVTDKASGDGNVYMLGGSTISWEV